MERLKLHNGKTATFLTTETDKEKTYYCDTHKEACSVDITLTDIGTNCSVLFGKHGWMVKVSKCS